MQGNVVARKTVAPRVGYRCVYRDEYPGHTTHPRSLFVAEDRVVPVPDDRLAEISSKDIDRAVAEMLGEASTDNAERQRSAGRARPPRRRKRNWSTTSTPSKRAWARSCT